MKGHQKTSSGYKTGSGSTPWTTPKAAPKEYFPQSNREESNSFKNTTTPKPKPAFEEFRSGSYNTRPQNNAPPPIPKRTGFMPSNPGADEPSAGKGNYSTSRINRSVPPPPPPPEASSSEKEDVEEFYRPAAPPVNPNTRPSGKTNDPLRQFRTEEETSYEPRVSTPYASSGGEKFDPRDAATMGRSKSTRDAFADPKPRQPVSRAGSDPSLASPHANGHPKNSTPKPTQAFTTSPDVSDSGNGPETNSQKPRVFAKLRKPVPVEERKEPDTAVPGMPNLSKRPSLREFQQWIKDQPNSDNPPMVSNRYADKPPAQEESKRQPSMYGPFPKYTASNPKEQPHHVKHASFSGSPLRHPLSSYKKVLDAYKAKYPGSFTAPGGNPTASPPSGGSANFSGDLKHGQKDKLHRSSDASTHGLNSFEVAQLNLVDQLLSNKERAQDSHQNGHVKPLKRANNMVHNDKAIYSFKSAPEERSSFNKKPSAVTKSHSAFPAGDSRLDSMLLDKLHAHANIDDQNSFSMKLDDETFSPIKPKEFSQASADNINTKFSSEEWHGKFEAGGDYFVPEQKTSQIPLHSRVRTQSSNRSRGRSPVKSRSADSKPFPASRPDSGTPIESPGGTKFSAQDWAETFKPQTFAPPSIPSPTKTCASSRVGSRKPRVPHAKPTVGSAALGVEDDGDSSDDKPLFMGRAPKAQKLPASPDAMDVDSPPPATPVPHPQASQAPPPPSPPPRVNGGLKINTEPLKRAAAPSQSPVDEESLKVEFDDMNIQELLSSLDLPLPPTAPKYFHESNTALSQGIYLSAFTAYMGDWDLFSKRMILHIIARKNQNDSLGSNRWEKPKGLDIYRRGLKEDGAVMSHWVAAMAVHDQVMKEFTIHMERFNLSDSHERERPRKKTH